MTQKGMHLTLEYYVYMLASQKNGTLYIGITNNLETGEDEIHR